MLYEVITGLIILVCIIGIPIIAPAFGIAVGIISAILGIIIGFGAAGITMIIAGIALIIAGFVITSYSIHYTKLYEKVSIKPGQFFMI